MSSTVGVLKRFSPPHFRRTGVSCITRFSCTSAVSRGHTTPKNQNTPQQNFTIYLFLLYFHRFFAAVCLVGQKRIHLTTEIVISRVHFRIHTVPSSGPVLNYKIWLLTSRTMMSTRSCSTKRLLHLLCVARLLQCNVMQDVVIVDYLKYGLEQLLLLPHHSGVKTKIGHSTVQYKMS